MTILLFILLNSPWCPPLDHTHTKQFRYGQWMKKEGVWQQSRLCNKKTCKYYKVKQYKYRK